jgi:hypothetical protein
MSSKIEKTIACMTAITSTCDIIQLCASCVDHRVCSISEIITNTHIKCAWVTLRCVECRLYKSNILEAPSK